MVLVDLDTVRRVGAVTNLEIAGEPVCATHLSHISQLGPLRTATTGCDQEHADFVSLVQSKH